MYNVSNEYKTQTKKPVRNLSYLKVIFDIIEPQAYEDVTLSTADMAYFSQLDETITDREVTMTYGTLEKNRFILDGKQKTCPIFGGQYEYQGLVSDTLCDNDKIWSEDTIILMSFSNYYEFVGLTFNFDTLLGNYPEELNIIAKLDDDNVLVETIHPTSSTYIFDRQIPLCNYIFLIPTKSYIPNRRFRLENIVFGVRKIFNEVDIVDSTWKRDVDVASFKIPNHSFDFSILDVNNEYNIDNSSGIYKYMEKQQPFKFSYGYELDDGTIEWVKGGDYVSTGDVTINSSQVIPIVTFKTISTINYLTQIYKDGDLTLNQTLYDLAEKVLLFANLPQDNGVNKWILDDSLKNYTTSVPLPILSVAEILQLIANAGMCTLDVDRYGYITMKPMSNTLQDFKYSHADVTNIPTAKKYPELRNVISGFNTLTKNTIVEEIANFDIENADGETYEFEFDVAEITSHTTSGTLTIVGGIEYFARTCRVALSGSGTLTLNGYKISVDRSEVKVINSITGEDVVVNNELIGNRNHAIAYANWCRNYFLRRNEYTIEDRGFVEVDSGDNVKLDTLYTNDYDTTVTYSEIKFNGALKGNTKLLEL